MIDRIYLRPIGPEDEPFLFSLYVKAREEGLESFSREGADKAQKVDRDKADQASLLMIQFKAHQHHYATISPQADQMIIEVDGRRAGSLIVIRARKEIRLAEIVLLPEYRNRGIGSALIEDLAGEAGRSGLPLRLHVAKFNRAIRLYRRLGFVLIGDVGTHYFMERRPKGHSSVL